MKKLLLILTFVLFSFSANAKQICKIKNLDVKSFVSVKQKFNYVKFSDDLIGAKRIISRREFAEEDEFKLAVGKKLYTYDLDDVINKKCKYGDVIFLSFYHRKLDLKKYKLNPFLLERNFNDFISRVCDRNKNIRQSIKEVRIRDKKYDLNDFGVGFGTVLDCVYIKKRSERDSLKHYEDN